MLEALGVASAPQARYIHLPLSVCVFSDSCLYKPLCLYLPTDTSISHHMSVYLPTGHLSQKQDTQRLTLSLQQENPTPPATAAVLPLSQPAQPTWSLSHLRSGGQVGVKYASLCIFLTISPPPAPLHRWTKRPRRVEVLSLATVHLLPVPPVTRAAVAMRIVQVGVFPLLRAYMDLEEGRVTKGGTDEAVQDVSGEGGVLLLCGALS